MEKLEIYQLSHIYREGNTKADKLVNLGINGSGFIKINNIKK